MHDVLSWMNVCLSDGDNDQRMMQWVDCQLATTWLATVRHSRTWLIILQCVKPKHDVHCLCMKGDDANQCSTIKNANVLQKVADCGTGILDKILVWENRCKGISAPSIKSLVLDKERIRPVGDFLWLWSALVIFFSALTRLGGRSPSFNPLGFLSELVGEEHWEGLANPSDGQNGGGWGCDVVIMVKDDWAGMQRCCWNGQSL